MTFLKTPSQIEFMEKELSFYETVTTAMLGTLDQEQILYVILSGITSGDGFGFNRAFLFLADETGRELRLSMAVGPSSQEEAIQIWDAINQDQLTLNELLPRYKNFKDEPKARALGKKLKGFSLPLHRFEEKAFSLYEIVLPQEVS